MTFEERFIHFCARLRIATTSTDEAALEILREDQ